MSINTPRLVNVETVSKGRRKFLGRAFMSVAAIASVAALDGCSSATVNGVTTITIDVAKVTSYTKTALAVVKTGLAFTGLPAAVTTVINSVITGVDTGLDAWATYTNGKETITFNSSSVPSALSSLVTILENAGTEIAAIAGSEATTMGATLTAKISAISTDVSAVASVVSSLISSAVSAKATAATWQDQQIAAIAARNGVQVGG